MMKLYARLYHRKHSAYNRIKHFGFKRISLKPGETGTVQFKLDSKELALWNRQMKQVVEPGEFKIMVGSSSEDIRAVGSFYVR